MFYKMLQPLEMKEIFAEAKNKEKNLILTKNIVHLP
jgi:hypothetical protein